jgi:hypothetical protein
LKRITVAILVIATVLLGSCSSSGGEHVVFKVATGFSQGGSDTTANVVDIGLPFGLYNLSDHTVRLSGIRLVGTTAAVHLRSVTAYRGNGVGIVDGDLLKLCRRSYRPYPVTDAVTQPHSNSRWFIVIAVTFTRPGRYLLHRVRIDYTANGQDGWQYQNLNTALTITAAAKGTEPAFSGCPVTRR